MEWVCGVFSSTAAAAWVEAVGTVLAAGIAVALYAKGRIDQRKDLAARRKVLHAMLREHVVQVAKYVAHSVAFAAGLKQGVNRAELDLQITLLALDNDQRLIELQEKLLEFGESGDAAIAAFIEACRSYHQAHQFWHEYVKDESNKLLINPQDGQPLALTSMRDQLERLAETVNPALAAVERFDKQ